MEHQIFFVVVDFNGGKRDMTVTDRRTKADFAHYIKHLVDNVFPEAKKLIIMDNLNTHSYLSILENFEFNEAIRLISKVIFYYTPKHASWLNMAEIEINVMDTQCTGRRISNKNLLISETTAYQNHKNKNKCKINWNFTKENADEKLSKYYI
ncbi:MAG: transposase [Candidatus Peribacteria bacterium]|jgi:transposase|nr:transposase [Candidatus Peribacteria bacterium]